MERALAEQAPSQTSSSAGSPEDRPRGNLHRRLERAHAPAETPTEDDLPLVNKLKKTWAKGDISTVLVQEIAEAAEAQGARDMKSLSSTGTGGVWPQNIQRSLLRYFGQPSGAPPFTWINLPVKGGMQPHPVLLPHQFFGTLFAQRRNLWNDWVRGPAGAASTFWREMAGTPIVKDHPGLNPKRLDMTLPVGLHGDGDAFSKQDSLFVLSWNSICGALGMDGFSKRFVYTIVRKAQMTDGTMPTLLRCFSWSLNLLLTGITPDKNFEGRPCEGGGQYIAGGWRAACLQVRGDWEFLANTLGFPNWQAGGNMCWLCAAETSVSQELLWTDMSATAGWRATKRTHQS